MNPFEEKPKQLGSLIMDWKTINSKPYVKEETSPYTKTRIILANGTEYEAVKFSHNFSRHCNDNDIRRNLALTRRMEQQQQKMIASLKPINENLLETTIGYEQLAVDLTAFLAQRATNKNVKNALDFALLEDFDHLYRYANLLENDFGIKAETLVGKYTEIMPGRPTIAHHRHPFDSIKPHGTKQDDIVTMLDTHIITAAEQQTMNYYMNQSAFYINEEGRKLYNEIGMVEEDHVTLYGSLLNPDVTMLECNLIHEYVECYIYYSLMQDETNAYVKQIWERCLEQEIAHLHAALELVEKYEHKSYLDVLPQGEFPEIISLHSNIDYLRKVLAKTVNNTSTFEGYEKITLLSKDDLFYKYQSKVNKSIKNIASHTVITDYIDLNGSDYRYEVEQNPIKALRDRTTDNIQVGVSVQQ